ncbi:MAG TPA: hypothetical protein VNA04_06175 [Thermoanaerobaculia bacterium]|nr:hypothetical protein [Thermoanaerobaculia bacterium]
MTADRAFRTALAQLVAALGELEAPSMIIGGVAVIAAGVPRDTIDIDATVLGSLRVSMTRRSLRASGRSFSSAMKRPASPSSLPSPGCLSRKRRSRRLGRQIWKGSPSAWPARRI